MYRIFTNLLDNSHAVLTNDDNKVIAIISCGMNEEITEKVKLAIKEDYIAEKVEITSIAKDKPVDNQPYEFSANVTDEDGDIVNYGFTLTMCVVY